MFKESGKILSLFFLIVAIAISLGVGFSVGKSQSTPFYLEGVTNTGFGKPEAVDFSLFWDAWSEIQTDFVSADSLNAQDMVHGAISGMIKSLGDPYTTFMNPEDTKKFLDDISGSFEGVGMEIGIRDRQLRVIAPLKGTPAYRAGLRAGDVIVKVDDTFTRNISIDEAVSLIRGPKGETVILGIMRDGWDEPKDFPIVRDVIEIISLEWELKEDNIAYIQLYHFSSSASNDFTSVALEIASSSADRIVLDLRNNPGGFLQTAVNIAGWFMERGSVVVIEDYGEGEAESIHKSQGNGMLISYPIVVLINQGSASASEILAGALRDNLDVILVGEQSFGKGSVQELKDLRDKSSLKVTIANWLTPAGHLIHDIGLEPDVEVKMEPEDYELELDPQLDKAIELVKEL